MTVRPAFATARRGDRNAVVVEGRHRRGAEILWRVGDDAAHRELYRLLGIPSEVMAPKKTWSTPPAPETPREHQDAPL